MVIFLILGLIPKLVINDENYFALNFCQTNLKKKKNQTDNFRILNKVRQLILGQILPVYRIFEL